MPIPFSKPAKNPTDLVNHLKSRGLIVNDQLAAETAIARIGYYRLLIYMRPLQDQNKRFFQSKSFEDILTLYKFDRQLRLLCLDAIETIEVALRAAIVNELAVQQTAHFYTESSHYINTSEFKNFIQTTLKSKSMSVDHYYAKYSTPSFPPIWSILETLSIGSLSKMYSNLTVPNRKIVAKCFKYDEDVLVSWFRAIAALRNKCAHQNRVWNTISPADKPKIARRTKSFCGPSQETFYARAVVVNALLLEIEPSSKWKQELKKLLSSNSIVNPRQMGFPSNWETMSFWS